MTSVAATAEDEDTFTAAVAAAVAAIAGVTLQPVEPGDTSVYWTDGPTPRAVAAVLGNAGFKVRAGIMRWTVNSPTGIRVGISRDLNVRTAALYWLRGQGDDRLSVLTTVMSHDFHTDPPAAPSPGEQILVQLICDVIAYDEASITSAFDAIERAVGQYGGLHALYDIAGLLTRGS
jgi:hypothetical protein